MGVNPVGVLMDSFCEDGGTPVMCSSLPRSWLIVHDGVMRRSEAVLSEMTSMGTSAMVNDMPHPVGDESDNRGWLIVCERVFIKVVTNL